MTDPGIPKDPGPGRDRVLMRGKFSLKYSVDGRVVKRVAGRNLVTSVGENLATEMFDPNGTSDPPDHFAIGSGTTTPTKDDTILASEVAGTRTAAGSSSVIGNQLTLVFQYTNPGPGDVTMQEIGIFNAAAGGDMVARFLTTRLDIASGGVIDLDWTIQFLGVD